MILGYPYFSYSIPISTSFHFSPFVSHFVSNKTEKEDCVYSIKIKYKKGGEREGKK